MAESSESTSAGPSLLSGQDAIDRILRPGNAFLPLKDEATLLGFLQLKLPEWIKDQSFACRNRIRDIELENRVELREAATVRRQAQDAYDGCERKGEIERRCAELLSARKECDGRRDFLSKMESSSEKTKGAAQGAAAGGSKGGRVLVSQDKLEEVRAALAEKQADIERLQAEYDALTADTPEWGALEAAAASEENLKTSLGLYAQKEKMDKAEKQVGRVKGSAGSNFEESVRSIIYDRIIPSMKAEPAVNDEEWGEVVAVRSVSLGIAKGEVDYMIVRKPKLQAPAAQEAVGAVADSSGMSMSVGGHVQPLSRVAAEATAQNASPVLVLAVVEVKQNPNDVGVVVDKYYERLSWMIGDERGYEAAEMRTKFYPQGHFNKPFYHKDGASGETMMFDASSFRLFARDASEPGGVEILQQAILKRLHFVVKERSLIGMSSGIQRKLISMAGSQWDARLVEGTAELVDPAAAARAIFTAITASPEAAALTTEDLLHKFEALPASQRNFHVVSSSVSPPLQPTDAPDESPKLSP